MKVLIACERSQVGVKEFRLRGHEAYSCDILASYGEYPEYHIQDDAIKILNSDNWDLVIAHPPCTYLSNARAAAYNPNSSYYDPGRIFKLVDARNFFMQFYEYPGRICIENPLPTSFADLPPYDQIVQPYYFGDPYCKRTCLWLKRLPPLMATCIEPEYLPWVQVCKVPGLNRQAARSQSFRGMLSAMAEQWGCLA